MIDRCAEARLAIGGTVRWCRDVAVPLASQSKTRPMSDGSPPQWTWN
jgi:hypothetical protein